MGGTPEEDADKKKKEEAEKAKKADEDKAKKEAEEKKKKEEEEKKKKADAEKTKKEEPKKDAEKDKKVDTKDKDKKPGAEAAKEADAAPPEKELTKEEKDVLYANMSHSTIILGVFIMCFGMIQTRYSKACGGLIFAGGYYMFLVALFVYLLTYIWTLGFDTLHTSCFRMPLH